MPIALLIQGGFKTWDDADSYKEIRVRWWKWRRYYIVRDPEDGNELRVRVSDVRCLELVSAEAYAEIQAEKKKREENSKNSIAVPGAGRFIGSIVGGRKRG